MFFDIVIIGCGPAGMTCAIQLKRQNIDCLVIEKDSICSLLSNANLIENYPGFPEGISGKTLAKLFEKQFMRYDINILYECVEDVFYTSNLFTIKTDGHLINSKILIIASGTKPIRLKCKGEAEIINKQLFYDLNKLKALSDKKICIIGNGDIAFDYALNLADKNNHVHIISRNNNLKCIKLLYHRCYEHDKIDRLINFDTEEIQQNKDKVVLISKDKRKIVCDYLLGAVGREIETSFLPAELKKMENIQSNNIPLFFIGDVKNGLYRQIGIAVGDGLKTAMKIAKLIN